MNLKELNKDQLIEIIETLLVEINQLKEENKKLKAQLNMNSSNSSMPPSTDGFKKKAKNNSLREKSGKKTGGQPKHKGHTLEKVENPDFVVELKDDICPHCSSNVENVPSLEIKTRQVFDIPEPEIEVTEYRAHSVLCPNCNKVHTSKFPETVTQPTSYGPRIKVLITNLNVQNHISYNRIKEFIKDSYGHNISEGTIHNTLKLGYYNLEKTESEIKKQIITSPQSHVDETGIYIEDSRYWLFVHSTNSYTYYSHHKKRGSEAMDEIGIIPNFEGVLTHDCWKAYLKYKNCSHSFCNAHFLRELNGIKENNDFKFPDKIKEVLLEMKSLVDSGNPISKELKSNLLSNYELEISNGYGEEEKTAIPSEKGKRGRKKQSKAKNLLDRMSQIDEVLGFFLFPGLIPFDNNLAERDVRMIKVKQKVSGLFRSESGANYFCRIRGYLSTLRKSGVNIYEGLKSVFSGNPILPQN